MQERSCAAQDSGQPSEAGCHPISRPPDEQHEHERRQRRADDPDLPDRRAGHLQEGPRRPKRSRRVRGIEVEHAKREVPRLGEEREAGRLGGVVVLVDVRVVGRLSLILVDARSPIGKRLHEREVRRLVVAGRMLEHPGREADRDDGEDLERRSPPGRLRHECDYRPAISPGRRRAHANRAGYAPGVSTNPHGSRSAAVVRLPGGETVADDVAVEEPLEIRVNGRAVAVTMRTPGHDEELALGFCLTEGLAPRDARLPDDLAANTVEVDAPDADLDRVQRSFYTSSSCGVCGKGALEAVAVEAPRIESELGVSFDVVRLTSREPARVAGDVHEDGRPPRHRVVHA